MTRERLADTLHQVEGLRAGEDDAAPLSRLVDDPLDGREELRHTLDLIDDDGELVGLEEKHGIGLCLGIRGGLFHGDVVEGATETLTEHGGLADLARPCNQDDFCQIWELYSQISLLTLSHSPRLLAPITEADKRYSDLLVKVLSIQDSKYSERTSSMSA